MSNNYQLIVKNSAILYIRLLVVAILGLFTSRILLQNLGVRGYGLFTIVGGLVLMMLFLQNSMAGTTQRFLNYETGKGSLKSQKEIFKACFIIHRWIALTLILMAETAGLWYLNYMMSIHADERIVANIVYQLSIFTFVAGVLNTPYRAAITAHENMYYLAYLSMAESGAKLIIALLLYFTVFEKIILYSACLLLINILIFVAYRIIAIRHYKECRTSGVTVSSEKLKEIGSFSLWANFEALGNLAHVQGIGLAINLFYGLTANAALGITNQVTGLVRHFIQSFMSAVNPQIVKNYAAKDIHSTHILVIHGCKMGAFLVALIAVPILIEAPFLLNLWLTEVPVYTISFVRLSMIMILFWSFSSPLITAQWSTGNIKNFQMVMATISLTHLPLTLIFLKLGFKPTIAFHIYIVLTIIKQIARIEFVCNSTGLNRSLFLKEVFGRSFFMISIASVIPLGMYVTIEPSVYSFVLVVIIWIVCIIVTFYFFSIHEKERMIIKTYLKRVRNHY